MPTEIVNHPVSSTKPTSIGNFLDRQVGFRKQNLRSNDTFPDDMGADRTQASARETPLKRSFFHSAIGGNFFDLQRSMAIFTNKTQRSLDLVWNMGSTRSAGLAMAFQKHSQSSRTPERSIRERLI